MKAEPIEIEARSSRTRVWILALAVAMAITIAVRSSAATLYVSQTSTNPSPPYATLETAATNIQDAVNAANDGDTVLVAPGQYGLSNQVTITKAITLRSTMGAGQTFLNTLANIWCLWISNSLAVADGFTMQNPSSPNLPQAGGAFLVGGTVQNCTFTNIHVGMMGASVFMTGGILSNSVVFYSRSPIGPSDAVAAVYSSNGGLVTDCQILGASPSSGFGDVMGVDLVDSQLRDSIVRGPEGYPEESFGAAVNALRSAIVGCSITHNLNTGPGGGAYLEDCLMDRCVVAYNSSRQNGGFVGGGGIFESNSIIRDSLIVSNTDQTLIDIAPGGVGGGVFMRGGALVNCTVSGNGVDNCPTNPPGFGGYGAGVYVESGGITNCIIHGNYFYGCVGGEDEWFNAGAGVFDHCCTAPDPGGSGNIIQDPQFLDPTNGNYHLASTSPCIAAGIVQPWMIGAFDLDGKPRTANGVVDMGAYQSPFAAPPPPPIANFSANRTSGYAPLSVQFTDESTGAVISWNWDFGDGSADSPAQNPSHTYTNGGDYIVTLTVTGGGGSDSNTLLVHVIGTAQTPQQQIASLVGEVKALVQQGALNRGLGNLLLARLRQAENSINEGPDGTACQDVGVFIKLVQAYVKRGTLTQSEGQSLIAAAVNLQGALGCLSL